MVIALVMQFYHPQGWERWIGVVFWIAVAFVFIDYIRTLLTLRKRKEISPATATSVLNSPFRKENRYGKRPSTPDVVWHVAFSARVGHGLTRATFHQHAHGPNMEAHAGRMSGLLDSRP